MVTKVEVEYKLKDKRVYKDPASVLSKFVNNENIEQKDIQTIIYDNDFVTIYYWVIK